MDATEKELDDKKILATPNAPTPSDDGSVSEQPTSLTMTADVEKRAVDHDSLVTVRLSEPPSLSVNTSIPPNLLPSRKTLYGIDYTPTDVMAESLEEEQSDTGVEPETPASIGGTNLQEELEQSAPNDDGGDEDDPEIAEGRRSSDSEAVNWEQLQKTEDMESKDQSSDNSTAALLERLEQENARIATNPKSVKVQPTEKQAPAARQPRPPSMAQLRQLVNGPTPPTLRYSVIPPPPMTELEFYMALVKDPQQTAARLPTLLANKVRKGIPPPLRGVVWQSMSGARDATLEDMFERLTGETSPYEGLITKDLGRSFPGVDMFRDPDGEGQRMLGRVLKCFSLYDTKIGYCQGLAFLVGPLLMHMPDKQAFCVLVKLMEKYDLRHCFVPDLSGLHVRIHQFQELLRQHLPTVSAHLDDLQVEPAYVSQWFLSFFAVTCPLPMLFRIYDVIFAEGASETIMRVALSLMRKNQARILACIEMEDVMQLLLSRGLWDCYHYNADEFVQDFVNLSDVVTRERMAALEQGYREAKLSAGANTKSSDAAQALDVTTAASRFLGRLWASSSTPKLASFAQAAAGVVATSSSSSLSGGTTLSPGLSAPLRPLSMLRRSTSKQSLASTLNSMDASASAPSSSAASVLSSASTEATTISRDSAADNSSRELSKATVASISTGGAKDDTKYLHSQIEDLLTALSELQRNNALLASQLQKEREDRDEDHQAVRSLLDGLRKTSSADTATTASPSGSSDKTITGTDDVGEAPTTAVDGDGHGQIPTADQLSGLLDAVEKRFEEPADRRSSIPQTKSELRDELARAKEQLSHELAKTQESNRKVYDMEQELATMKDQLRDSHAYVRNLHAEKQRVEKQLHGLRARASDTPASSTDNGDWFSRAAGAVGAGVGAGAGAAPTPAPASSGGLRELKLGRSRSTPSQAPSNYSKRVSSISQLSMTGGPGPVAPSAATAGEYDALLLELAQAKTAEAIAKQEAEEAKQKLETLRKAFGMALGGEASSASQSSTSTPAASGASAAASAAIGMIGRLTGSAAAPARPDSLARSTTTPGPTTSSGGNTGSGGFWGWRR